MRRWRLASALVAGLCSVSSAQITTIVPGGGSGASQGSDLASGIAHRWSFDEASGDREDTLHPGSGNAWAPSGSPASAAGVQGDAVSIAPGKYLALTTSVVFPSQTFTVAFWIKPASFTQNLLSSPPGAPIFVSSMTSSGLDLYQAYGTTTIGTIVYPSGGTNTVAGDALSTGSFHLVVIWWNQATATGGFEIDHANPKTFTGTSFVRTSGTMLLAFNNPAANITALVDEMVVWDDRILTSAERGRLMTSFYPF